MKFNIVEKISEVDFKISIRDSDRYSLYKLGIIELDSSPHIDEKGFREVWIYAKGGLPKPSKAVKERKDSSVEMFYVVKNGTVVSRHRKIGAAIRAAWSKANAGFMSNDCEVWSAYASIPAGMDAEGSEIGSKAYREHYDGLSDSNKAKFDDKGYY